MSAKYSSFPSDFNLNAFFAAMPVSLKTDARNGASHLKVLKAQGKRLQGYMVEAFSLKLSAAQALDVTARTYGFSDYNEARSALLKTGNSGEETQTGALVHNSDTGNYPSGTYVKKHVAWLQGGFFAETCYLSTLDFLPPASVVTGYGLVNLNQGPNSYCGFTPGHSDDAFLGSCSFFVKDRPLGMSRPRGATKPQLERVEQNVTLTQLAERAERIAKTGFDSYLALDSVRQSKDFVESLFSAQRPYIPVVFGDDYSDFVHPEGVFARLWATSVYPVFVPELSTTFALGKTAREVAKCFHLSEERALALLMNIPKDHYLRVPPERRSIAD